MTQTTAYQTTLRRAVTLTGVGLHRGAPATATLRPAPVEQGIWFKRVDIDAVDALVPAQYDRVTDTTLCTLIANESGVTVSTVEHVMAAIAGLGLTNVLVEVDGPEIPIMDGSAKPFVDAIRSAGIVEQSALRRAIRVLEPVSVSANGGEARLEPAPFFEIDFTIEFDDAAIGRQSRGMRVANGAFAAHLADSRTFCRALDVERMRAAGLALGGSMENAIVVDADRVLNPEGLRHPDEYVRHKMLDAVGDLALAGAPIIGRYVGHRAGHGVTNALLRALFDRPEAWRIETVSPATAPLLPGFAADRTREGLRRIA
ncbi:MAG: UDP-3-O-acyl-N-acetylglucosamine deacetylase [Rubricella sp.]